jgi:hypothetical protein
VFTLRVFHNPVVFMLGPEANHFMTVAHPELFEYRVAATATCWGCSATGC